jgi:hypothetical protein
MKLFFPKPSSKEGVPFKDLIPSSPYMVHICFFFFIFGGSPCSLNVMREICNAKEFAGPDVHECCGVCIAGGKLPHTLSHIPAITVVLFHA